MYEQWEYEMMQVTNKNNKKVRGMHTRQTQQEKKTIIILTIENKIKLNKMNNIADTKINKKDDNNSNKVIIKIIMIIAIIIMIISFTGNWDEMENFWGSIWGIEKNYNENVEWLKRE